MVEVLTLVFQRGSLLSHTNDNYLNGPTVSLVNQVQLDPQCQDKSLSVCQNLKSYQTSDKTKDLRQGKDLVFVSFRKGFHKDIVPATISSCCVISSQTKQPKIYIKLELMMFGPLQLLRLFKEEFLWIRFSQPVIGKPTIPSPSSI